MAQDAYHTDKQRYFRWRIALWSLCKFLWSFCIHQNEG